MSQLQYPEKVTDVWLITLCKLSIVHLFLIAFPIMQATISIRSYCWCMLVQLDFMLKFMFIAEVYAEDDFTKDDFFLCWCSAKTSRSIYGQFQHGKTLSYSTLFLIALVKFLFLPDICTPFLNKYLSPNLKGIVQAEDSLTPRPSKM